MNSRVKMLGKETTLEHIFEQTMERLAASFCDLNPGESKLDFINKYIAPLVKIGRVCGDTIENETLVLSKKHGNSINVKNAPIIISFAYCMQVKKALEDNDREQAWSYMVNASYWNGCVAANGGVELSIKQIDHAIRKDKAKKGGIARAESKYKDSIQEAFRLAREKSPKEKGWKSRLQATESIFQDVFDYSKSKGSPLAVNNAKKTIYGWLKKMPDASTLFPRINNK